MASNNNNIDDQLNKLREAREEAEMLGKLEAIGWQKVNGSIMGALKNYKSVKTEEQNLAKLRKAAEKQEQNLLKLKQDALNLGRQLTQAEQELIDKEEELVKFSKEYADSHQKTLAAMKSQLSIGTAMKNSVWAGMGAITVKIWEQVATLPGFLNDADKALRQMALHLGTSGGHTENIRKSTLASAKYAAQFGLSVRDLTAIQGKYTELTGKANTLSKEELKSVIQIAKGTGLAADNAAEMAANFSLIGLNATRVADMVTSVVNDADSLGLNSSVILNNMNKNFAKSQEYNFRNGAEGLKKMATQAAQLKISMESTFAAADKARNLEGSLEMAAQLMVMGGNFAKTDPFQLAFLSRNDPAKFQKALADMTKGVASFNKETGEFSVSAYDMDRLRSVAEATGVSINDLKQSAIDFAQISSAKSNLFVGSDEDKEYIARMAKMAKNGTFTIDVGGSAVELSKLTGEQVSLLKTQKQTLEQRAKDAQAFDEVFGNFLLELKSTALPLLSVLTKLLGYTKSAIDGMRKAGLGWVAGLAILFAGTVTLFKGVSLLKGIAGGIVDGIKGRVTGGGSSGGTGGSGGSIGGSSGSTGGSGGGGGVLGKLGGTMGSAATIAAIGVAAVGLGYGLKLAAEGISNLAVAMKGMTGGEMAALLGITLGLGAAFVGFGVAMSGALTAIGANPAAWVGIAALAAISASMVGVGFAVKLASDGIGNMMSSIGNLANIDLSSVGSFFGQMTGFMEAKSDNFDKLKETINFLKESEKSFVAEINKAFSQPIKMTLTGDTTLSCNIEITNNIDGDKMVNNFTKKFQVAILDATKGMRNI